MIVSIAAFGCLDYFFVEPLYSFRVSDPGDTMALFACLLTALVITSLVSRVRVEAKETRLQKQRLERLYRLAQELFALESVKAVESQFLAPVLGIFGVTAVCFFDAISAEIFTVGSPDNCLATKTRDAYIVGADLQDESRQITVCRLPSSRRVLGAVGFQQLEEPALTARPLSTLVAAFLDRIRALRSESESAAAAQAEVYRSVVLDALAHEFKTPLTTILAAAGGLREVGPLTSEQLEMTETVELETARLGSLTSRLLRTARLDKEAIHPRMEITDSGSVAAQVVKYYSALSSDRPIVLKNIADSEILADPELLRLSLGQLIENACKYSRPGSTVIIETGRRGDNASIEVTNSGDPIPAQERRRIFDRFYRGAEARTSTAGSGLGLYIARKIAIAHGGHLELVTDEAPQGTVKFRLTLPMAKPEVDHVIVE